MSKYASVPMFCVQCIPFGATDVQYDSTLFHKEVHACRHIRTRPCPPGSPMPHRGCARFHQSAKFFFLYIVVNEGRGYTYLLSRPRLRTASERCSRRAKRCVFISGEYLAWYVRTQQPSTHLSVVHMPTPNNKRTARARWSPQLTKQPISQGGESSLPARHPSPAWQTKTNDEEGHARLDRCTHHCQVSLSQQAEHRLSSCSVRDKKCSNFVLAFDTVEQAYNICGPEQPGLANVSRRTPSVPLACLVSRCNV